jgi:hypothetical protein
MVGELAGLDHRHFRVILNEVNAQLRIPRRNKIIRSQRDSNLLKNTLPSAQ